MKNLSASEGKTEAIISHFWILGLLIALILNTKNRNFFTSFYIRQMIGFNILIIVNKYIVYDLLGTMIGMILGVVLFVFWVISLIGAIKEEEKLIPVFGNHFQDWFKNIQ